MKTILKAIRLLGVFGGAWIVWSHIIIAVFNKEAGAPMNVGYFLTVMVPYGLWAIFLVLPYSTMKGGLWTASFALLCISGAYVCLYMATHLAREHWLMILPFFLLFISQPVAIWLFRQRMPNKVV